MAVDGAGVIDIIENNKDISSLEKNVKDILAKINQ